MVFVSGFLAWIWMTSCSNMAMYLSWFFSLYLFISNFGFVFHYFLHFLPFSFFIYLPVFWLHKSIKFLDHNNKYQLLKGTFSMYLVTKDDATYTLIRHISKCLRSQFLRRKDISSLTSEMYQSAGLIYWASSAVSLWTKSLPGEILKLDCEVMVTRQRRSARKILL